MKRLTTLATLILLVATALPAQTTLQKPQAKPATSITAKAFTANWGAVEGAEAYCAYVYTRRTVATTGWQTIVDEDFPYITSGTINDPDGGDEEYADLAEHGFTQTYGWTAYAFPNYIPSMVAGLLYSPYLDLRANEGRYRIIVTSYCSDGDQLRIESHGKGETETRLVTLHVANGGQGMSTDTIDFDNGSKDLFFSIINVTAADGAPDYFDRVSVQQQMTAGETIATLVASNEAVMATDEMTGDSITSCRFSNLSYLGGQTTVYYDVYAVATDYTTPSGHLPYTTTYSDFSDLVKVDLSSRTSEVVTAVKALTTTPPNPDNAWYNLQGQRTDNPTRGIFIHAGRRILMK